MVIEEGTENKAGPATMTSRAYTEEKKGKSGEVGENTREGEEIDRRDLPQ